MPEALYWYGSIFLWMFFTGIGIPPVPEELAILYPVGLTAEHPEVRWWLAWPITIVGILAADMVLYCIGRFGGRRLLRIRWMQRILPPEREQKIERNFFRHGGWIILTARTLPPLRTSVFITAGLIKYPLHRYLIADTLCAAVAVSLVYLGLGSVWGIIRSLIHEIDRPLYWVLAFFVIGGGGYAVYRYFRYVKQHAAEEDLQPPSLHVPGLGHKSHPEIDPAAPHHEPEAPAPQESSTPDNR